MTTTELDTRAREAEARARDLHARLLHGAIAEGRTALSAGEQAAVDAAIVEMNGWRARADRARGDATMRDQIGRLAPTPAAGGDRNPWLSGDVSRSLGAQFFGNPEVAEFIRRQLHRQAGVAWTTPSVELMAATLDETSSPIVVPQYLPGVVPSATPPVVMSQLFAGGIASSNAITFMKETLFDNEATATAEGAVKPESSLQFTPITEKLIKVPTYLVTTDEFLDDVPQALSFIDARLRLMIMLSLDNEILNGSGVAPHMTGILNRTDLAAAIPVGSGGPIDALGTQIGTIENVQSLPVDGVVMNGLDAIKLGLTKTTVGDYLMGSPFTQPGPTTLFGRPVVRTPYCPQGTALVGSFRSGGGQLFQKGGINMAVTNAHSDYFVKNLTAIRAEIRAALLLYRPAAFGVVTGI